MEEFFVPQYKTIGIALLFVVCGLIFLLGFMALIRNIEIDENKRLTLESSTKIFETPNNTTRAVKPVVIPPNISSKKKTDCIYVGIGEDIKDISVNFDDSYATIQERVSKAIKELSQRTTSTVIIQSLNLSMRYFKLIS